MHWSRMVTQGVMQSFGFNGHRVSNRRCDWRVVGLIYHIRVKPFRIEIVCEGKLCGNVDNAGLPNKRVPEVLLFVACRANA